MEKNWKTGGTEHLSRVHFPTKKDNSLVCCCTRGFLNEEHDDHERATRN